MTIFLCAFDFDIKHFAALVTLCGIKTAPKHFQEFDVNIDQFCMIKPDKTMPQWDFSSNGKLLTTSFKLMNIFICETGKCTKKMQI